MATEVFNRQELKFVISRETYASIHPIILQYMRLDKHNADGKAYRLYNLYIDTADFALIRHSMAKPTVFKEKIRIRSYAPLLPDTKVFLEVKKRYRKITNKRRTKILMSEALEFVKTGTSPAIREYMNSQVVHEFAGMLRHQAYQPTVYISYDRIAFHVLDTSSDLRITFDTNLTSQSYGQKTSHNLLGEDELIMEVKSTDNVPMWLARLLDSRSIYKQSFSKYGTEHRRTLLEKMELQYV